MATVEDEASSAIVAAWLAPEEPSVATTVYRFFDASDRLLYVGVTHRARQRIADHAADKDWWADVVRATFEHFPSRHEALKAEARAISLEDPLHNVIRPDAFTGLRHVRGFSPSSKTRGGSGYLNTEDRWRLLEKQTQRHFGVDAGEFIRAFEAGDIPKSDPRLKYIVNLLCGLSIPVAEFGL